MKDEKLYEVVFEDEIYVHGQTKKIKKTVHLTKEEKDQHDTLIKKLEDARLSQDIAMKKYKEHAVAWEKREKDDKYWAENKKLVKINTEYMYLVSGAEYNLFMFEYNWITKGYEENEIDYPDTTDLEIEAGEEEMRRWDEEDPFWRIANDFD